MELGRVNLRSKLLLVGADRCTTGTFFDVKYIGWLVGTAGVPANFFKKEKKDGGKRKGRWEKCEKFGKFYLFYLPCDNFKCHFLGIFRACCSTAENLLPHEKNCTFNF